ncbi:hypothetical protein HA402_000694 [Bradysia odoriphaga]|nr:hypothetical protein HA402_000694 [Bradysia odoriphaga]
MQNVVIREVTIHAVLKHPAILELYTYFADDKYMYLVLELAENGSLKHLIDRRFRLKEDEAADIISQVVNGLLFLHTNKILHRDISLGNLLLTGDNRIKIADFGLATKLTSTGDKHMTMCGTPNYISPEVVSRDYGLPTDVWGLGVVLYHLLVGRAPFEANTSEREAIKSTFTNIVKKDHELPTYLSWEAKDLIDRLLCKNPNQRIKLEEVMNHSFIAHHTKQHLNVHLSGDSGLSRTSSSQNVSQNPFLRSQSVDRHKNQLSVYYENAAPGRTSSSLYNYEEDDYACKNVNEYMSPARNVPRYRSLDVIPADDCALNVKDPPQNYRFALRDRCVNDYNNPYDTGQKIGRACPESPNYFQQPRVQSPFKTSSPANANKEPTTEEKLSVSPLTTAHLPPYEYNVQKFTFKIQSNGELIIESRKGRSNNIDSVYRISNDGLQIAVHKPNVQSGFRDSVFTYSTLPSVHWNKYKIAAKFITYLREKTPIVTYYTPTAKCELMVTLKDFKVSFETGEKIIKTANDVKLIDSNGHTSWPSGKLSETKKMLWEHYEKCLTVCMRQYESVHQMEPSGCCFPLTMGQRPQNGRSRLGECTPQTPPSISSFAFSTDTPASAARTRVQNRIR